MKSIAPFLLGLVLVQASFAGDKPVTVARLDPHLNPGMAAGVEPASVTEHYEYYKIRGNTEDALQRQLRSNSCLLNNGKRFHSVTAWSWTLRYGYQRTPQTCSLDAFQVDLEIKYRYPKWVQGEETPRPLLDKWDNYMASLVEHEQGHRDLAVSAAVDLSREAAALPPASNCRELDRQVRSLGNERMARLNDDEKRYDDRTDHGRTQGAFFP